MSKIFFYFTHCFFLSYSSVFLSPSCYEWRKNNQRISNFHYQLILFLSTDEIFNQK